MINGSRLKLAAILGAVALVALIAFFSNGDSKQTLNTPAQRIESGDLSGRRDLNQGLDFLGRLDEFDSAEVHQKILYHLRQWLKRQTPDPNWMADPLVKQQGLVSDEQLAPLDLEIYDVQVLQEATWLRDVARTVIQEGRPSPDLQILIQNAGRELDETTASDLGHATQLFDWTVRNLLLDVQNAPGDTQRTDSPVILQAWEALQMGRGTVWEKSRVFVLLARQIGLPVVILAVEKGDGKIEPWLPAVLLGDELFLFDMRLATPIPGADRNIATLSEVIDDPGILDQMAEQSGASSPINEQDLGRVVALIDATPGYLSQRMALLEQQLMGDAKTVLTVAATPLAKRLATVDGIKAVGIWQMPYEGFAIRARLTSMPESVQWLATEHRLFDRRTPLVQARLLHFRGRFDPTEDLPGARQFYLECRRPDAQIEAITEMSVEGERTPQEVAIYRQRLKDVQDMMLRTKQCASFWLGLIAFERGEFKVAASFFEKRLIEAYPGSMWTSGAKYNLGRCHEAIGVRDGDRVSLERAIDVYESVQNSPMTPACTWRAAEVTRKIDEASPPETDLLPAE